MAIVILRLFLASGVLSERGGILESNKNNSRLSWKDPAVLLRVHAEGHDVAKGLPRGAVTRGWILDRTYLLQPWVSSTPVGSTPRGAIPAEKETMTLPFNACVHPSDVWLLQELPVKRKRTLSFLESPCADMPSSSRQHLIQPPRFVSARNVPTSALTNSAYSSSYG
jgi:hypothetical protein